MNTVQKCYKLGLSALMGLSLLSSCSKDKNPSNSTTTAPQPYLLTLAYAPASGYDYSYFTVAYDDIMSGTINAKGKGLEQVGYFDYTKIGNTLYSIGGLNDVKVTALQLDAQNNITETGAATFPQALSDIVEADNNNLLAVSMKKSNNMITFYQIAKNSVSVSKTVNSPVSDILKTADQGLSYSGMAVVGDKVFLSYYINNLSNFETPETDRAELAVFSYPDLKFIKVISDSRVGPIGGFNIKGGLVKDESGNVYAISHSNPANGYSKFTKPAGILKIAKGTTEFDPTYLFDITVKTGGKTATHIVNLGSGKAFAELNITDRASQTAWSDGVLQSAIINFNTQEVNVINGIPNHNGDGRRLPILAETNSVFIQAKDGDKHYIYKVNTQDYTAQKGAVLESSFVAGIFK